MKRIAIMTDSTSDLPASLADDQQITIIPLYVNFKESFFRDGIDLNAVQLYDRVAETNEFPKTASPSPSDFISSFQPVIEAGNDILFIGISSHISSTIQNARIAASEFPKHRIEIIDSLNLSTGIGMLVMKAHHLNQENRLSLQALSQSIQLLIPKVRTFFAVDTLEYLYRGGRCSSLENLIGGMLRIHPILAVVDGQIIVTKKVRGKRDKLLKEMLELHLGDSSLIDPSLVMINHSLCPEDAAFLTSEIKKILPDTDVTLSEAGCVISSHCGPRTFSIVSLANS